MSGGVQRKGGKKNRKFKRNRGRVTNMGQTGGSSAKYAARGHREKNKARRIAADERRAKPMPCGHGSRHESPYDGRCRVCVREQKVSA